MESYRLASDVVFYRWEGVNIHLPAKPFTLHTVNTGSNHWDVVNTQKLAIMGPFLLEFLAMRAGWGEELYHPI